MVEDCKLSKLNLSDKVLSILESHDIRSVYELWCLKRKDLKEWGLRDMEIKSVIISLQLMGLDLGKKRYK